MNFGKDLENYFLYTMGHLFKIKLSGQRLVHCHGLFALVIAHIAGISNTRIIFTPQGSDILVLPDKNFLVRNSYPINYQKSHLLLQIQICF